VSANVISGILVTSVTDRNDFVLTTAAAIPAAISNVLPTLAGAGGVAQNDTTAVASQVFIVRESATATNGVVLDHEFGRDNAGAYSEADHRNIFGLEGIIDDGTNTDSLHGIDEATYPNWQAQVIDGGTPTALQNLSLQLMLQLFDAVDEMAPSEVGGVNWMLTHHSVARQYVDLLQGDVRYAPQMLDGGFYNLTFSAGGRPVPLWLDRDCRYNTLYAGAPGCFRIVETRPLGFERKGGGIVKLVQNRDAIESRLAHYWNWGVVLRSPLGKIPNVRVTGLNQ